MSAFVHFGRLSAIIILCLFSSVFAYSGGSGEPNDPYQIANATDLLALAANTTDYSKAFVLVNDINLAGYTFTKAVISPDTTLSNSFEGTAFTGVFDGNGHSIVALEINTGGVSNSCLGLFGQIDSGGSIKNLGIEDANITGGVISCDIGGLCGWNYGSITNCYSTGNVSGSGEIGGLCGFSYGGSLTDCYSTGNVSGTSSTVGGLCGFNGSSINNCYSSGTVSGRDSVGGLCGYNNDNGSITNCYSTGVTVSGCSSVGGLVGSTSGIIINCNSTGNVSGSGNGIGGLCGSGGGISNCYSTGNVSGTSYVGGLCGGGGGSINNCYSTGTVSGTSYVGGLCGGLGGSITSCYFLNTSGPNNGRGTPLTEVQMKQQLSFTGWNFAVIWDMADGQTYPFFKNTTSKYSGGSGEPNDPYKIANINDLLDLAADTNDYNDCFVLVNDINLAGCTFTKAVIAPDTTLSSSFQGTAFTGVFDGNGHSIVSLKVDVKSTGNDFIGLFGRTDPNSTIKNLSIENTNIIGDYYVGTICGYNRGTISDCYVTGTLTGNYYIGGLCGGNYSLDGIAYISNCYTNVIVAGGRTAGGLCGYNNGILISCYSTGMVTGIDSIGGLCGSNYGGIKNCYFLDTAGTNNGKGTPLTDAQMKQQASYIGWDFFGEISNGTSSYWIMKPNSYPHLYVFDSSFMPYEFDGQGTAVDPYLIYDANDLGAMWQKPYSCYKLVNDVNLDDIQWSIALVSFFDGNFDGNNHIISNLSISGGPYLSLFSWVSKCGSVKNLGIEDVNIIGYISTGGLCSTNNGNISNCFSTGVITGDGRIGGLCGYNYGNIADCYSTVRIIESYIAGGLCAENWGGTVRNCYATGAVTGDGWAAGGLCGRNTFGIINKCYSIGAVKGNNYAGGLFGYNYRGTISNCYATGATLGFEFAGGLCGSNYYGNIINCYAKGVTHGSSDTGGLCGIFSGGSITNCYATGMVSGDSHTGGLCGSFDGMINSCYFLNTSGLDNDAGEPLTDMQMKQLASFTGWDFTTPVWKICNGTNYPKLEWQRPLAGDFVCPDGVDIYDLAVFIDQWLLEELSYDLYQDDRHIVNFLDYSNFANSWNGDKAELAAFAGEWLRRDAYNADIAPDVEDGIVNFLDFAAFAENWLE